MNALDELIVMIYIFLAIVTLIIILNNKRRKR